MDEHVPDLADRIDTDPEYAAELVPRDVEVITETQHFRELLESDPEILPQVRNYYALLLVEYQQRAGEIERFLGFVESCEELSARIHKIEMFLGIKPRESGT